MEITFINVGYGDAIIIQAAGHTTLLDGGSARSAEFDGFAHRIRTAKYFQRSGMTQIDLLIISHIHEDHICGLEEVLATIQVKEIRLPFSPLIFPENGGFTPDVDAPRSAHLFSQALSALCRILRVASARGTRIVPLFCGDTLTLPGDLRLTALAPSAEAREKFTAMLEATMAAQNQTELLVLLDRSSNHSSLLLKLEGEGTALLLTGDSCPTQWGHIDASLFQNVNVLKLPHHGQKDSFSQEIMEKMPLTHVVTTASSDRRYHSANAAVYDALRRLHPQIQLLFTDERAYPPYFDNPAGACATKLVIHSAQIKTEYINKWDLGN